MTFRPLAPCRCGHPGKGCSCYEERVAEAGWNDPPPEPDLRPDLRARIARIVGAHHGDYDGTDWIGREERENCFDVADAVLAELAR
jgi:hypothetical protein